MSIKYVYLDINVYLDKTSNYFSGDELDFKVNHEYNNVSFNKQSFTPKQYELTRANASAVTCNLRFY